jgi:hypothetical protein
MRDMIFNDASVAVPAGSIHDVAPLLADIARGMAMLVNAKSAFPALRMRRPLYDVPCASDGSLFDAIQTLRSLRAERDATLFLFRLSQKAPLTIELPPAIVDRFRGCEAITPSAADGEGLMLCAHLGGIAISLPLDPCWDADLLMVRFLEITDDGLLEEVSDHVDNLARAAHARLIVERDRIGAREQVTRETFWESRQDVFPRLKFGLDVEDHIRVLDPGVFGTVIRRINDIHQSVLDWKELGGDAPPWRCKVTPESDTTMGNERLRQARVFRDSAGFARLYEWHARFGSAGRIHLHVDGTSRDVEIGYIGRHLPLN